MIRKLFEQLLKVNEAEEDQIAAARDNPNVIQQDKMKDEAEEEASEITPDEEDEDVSPGGNKEYLGNNGTDMYFYLIKTPNAEGGADDLQVTDSSGKILFSAKEHNLAPDNVKDFLVQALKEVDMSNIAFEIVMKYMIPAEEKSEEEIEDDNMGKDEEASLRSPENSKDRQDGISAPPMPVGVGSRVGEAKIKELKSKFGLDEDIDTTKIGSGELPNKYYVTVSSDYMVETEPATYNWASDQGLIKAQGFPSVEKVFDTYKEARAYAEELMDELSPEEPHEDGFNSIAIEDHLSGEVFSAGLYAKKVTNPYKYYIDYHEDVGFTKNEMEKQGEVFENLRKKFGLDETKLIDSLIEKYGLNESDRSSEEQKEIEEVGAISKKYGFGTVAWQDALIELVKYKIDNDIPIYGALHSFIQTQIEHTQRIGTDDLTQKWKKYNLRKDEANLKEMDKLKEKFGLNEEVLLRGIESEEKAKEKQRKKEYKNSEILPDDLNPGKFKLVKKAEKQMELFDESVDWENLDVIVKDVARNFKKITGIDPRTIFLPDEVEGTFDQEIVDKTAPVIDKYIYKKYGSLDDRTHDEFLYKIDDELLKLYGGGMKENCKMYSKIKEAELPMNHSDVPPVEQDIESADVPTTPDATGEAQAMPPSTPEEAQAQIKMDYPEEPFTSTALAYADLIFDEPKVFGAIRNLQWPGVYSNGETFLKQVKIIDHYNKFTKEVAQRIVDKFGDDAKYKLARDGSVAVFITILSAQAEISLSGLKDLTNADKVELTNEPGEIKLWWD